MYLPVRYQFARPLRRIRRGIGQLSVVANTIQTVEGWFPGSVSYTNNNPGNLTCANQTGMIGCSSSGFAIFPDYSTGYQALENQISLDASRGESILQFTNKYAPASDGNDPSSYAQTIAGATGLSVNDPLSTAIAGDGSDGSGSIDLSSIGLGTIDPVTLGVVIAVSLVGLYFAFK